MDVLVKGIGRDNSGPNCKVDLKGMVLQDVFLNGKLSCLWGGVGLAWVGRWDGGGVCLTTWSAKIETRTVRGG